MRPPSALAVILLAAAAAPPLPARAAEEAATPPKPAAETAIAERGRFDVVLELTGDFEPLDAALVEFRPDAWAQPLRVVRVLPHGSRVAAGDAIIEYDTTKLDQAIVDLELDLAAGARALEIARLELPVSEALHPLEMAAAERAAQIAAEDRARFETVGRRLAEDAARFAERAAAERLKYSGEELRQLEKMYKDKDLTEETEEMILQRTRFDVEQAEFALGQMKIRTQDALELDLPRKADEVERAAEKAALELRTARETLPIQLEQKRLALAKLEHERSRSLAKLEELKADRGKTTVKAPRAGTLYHGRLQDGAWTTSAVSAKAVVGSAVSPAELVFTVVDPARVGFRAKLAEKDLHLLTPGLAGKLQPTGWPDVELAVKAGPPAAAPRDGKFEVRFDVPAGAEGPLVVPGMTGTAKFTAYSQTDAVTLPSGAVFRDDDGGRCVYVVKTDGKPEQRPVKVGRAGNGRTEILEGVAPGERVRTTKP